MKRILSFVTAAAITLGAGSTLASQYNSDISTCELPYCTQTAAHTHRVCSIAACVQAVNHWHNGVIYYAHHEKDGHLHNRQNVLGNTDITSNPYNCDVSGCKITEQHEHSVCNQPDCTETSSHDHDGVIYYGHISNDIDNRDEQSEISVPVQNTTEPYYCGVSGCNDTAEHNHSNCTVSGCSQTTDHDHDGVIYYSHISNDIDNRDEQSEISVPVQNTTEPYYCGVSGCNDTAEHNHSNCTVSGCNQMTDHDHYGVIYYGHSSSDGHAYHNCGVSGCFQSDAHTHNSCGVSGCGNTGSHSHGNKSSGHKSENSGGHKSGHGGGHH